MWHDWPQIAYQLSPGRLRSSLPLITRRFDTRCSQIHQPIYTRFAQAQPELYDNEFVKSLSTPHRPGVGLVLTTHQGPLRTYPDSPSLEWLPRHLWDFHKMVGMLARQVFEFQLYLFEQGPKATNLDPTRREIAKTQLEFARKVNQLRLRQLQEMFEDPSRGAS
jgi:hypothetical protein